MFKIGQKVAAVESYCELVKGEIYIVDGFNSCNCGNTSIVLKGINATPDRLGVRCSVCGKPCFGTRAFNQKRLRPLDETFTEETIAMLNEHFESLKQTV